MDPIPPRGRGHIGPCCPCGLGCCGQGPTNVLRHFGLGLFSRGRRHELKVHRLPHYDVQRFSKRSLDPQPVAAPTVGRQRGTEGPAVDCAIHCDHAARGHRSAHIGRDHHKRPGRGALSGLRSRPQERRGESRGSGSLRLCLSRCHRPTTIVEFGRIGLSVGVVTAMVQHETSHSRCVGLVGFRIPRSRR